MRLPITITNTDRHGRVTRKWWVKIGKKPFRGFSQQEWVEGGIAWIQSQLGG